MVAQNLQSRHAEMRAESDFDVNVKAEKEVADILHHLEYQEALLLGFIRKMGLTVEECVGPTCETGEHAGGAERLQ
jgi:hypothetical protein